MIGFASARLERQERAQQDQRGASRRRACAPRSRPYSLDLTIAKAPSIVASVISTEPSTSTPPARPMPSFSSISTEPSSERDHADRHVHEEDPVPVQRLRQRAAGEQPDRAAAGGDERVEAHRLAPARPAPGNSVTMIARITLEATAPPTPCSRRAADQHRLAGGQPAQHRGGREQHEARQEHALAPDQVADAPGQQQQPAERDQVAVDHPGQVALGEVQVVLDRRQRDVHDRRVEDHHQLAEAEHGERDPAAALAPAARLSARVLDSAARERSCAFLHGCV